MKNILVTGGLQGIGRAIVQMLCKRGDRLFIFDIAEKNDERVQELVAQGIWYHQVNVAQAASVNQGFLALAHELSSSAHGALDVLVNNAGVTRDGMVIRMSENDWDAVMDVNLKGAFICSQKALTHMIRQHKSYIINISSVVGIHGNAGQANYASSKGGLIALTKSLAYEYARRNVIVNAVAPGFIATPMTAVLSDEQKDMIRNRIALGRFGVPEDIAHVVAFLTSGNADYITGQVIEVSGGLK